MSKSIETVMSSSQILVLPLDYNFQKVYKNKSVLPCESWMALM